MPSNHLPLALCLALLAACSPPADAPQADGGQLDCAPGDIRPCDIRPGCPGEQRCVDGAFERCQAPDERCNGVDDDCDGATDEAWPAVGEPCGGGQGACADTGRFVCDADGADVVCSGPIEPTAERCDGADDDCDGAIDEAYPELGMPCTTGDGACAARGTVVCADDGTSRCDAIPGDGTDEVCDGNDNDCDGAVDEDIAEGLACETGADGACGPGATRCVGGETRCAPLTGPSDEVCDGVDDDCDGAVDERDDGGALAEPCYDGPADTADVGPCRTGTRTCADGGFGPCVDQALPGDEICDGLDEDCDGAVDEGLDCACLRDAQQACYGGPEGTEGVGPCRGGTQVCRPDGSGFGPCAGRVLPADEVCNGLDDDCDGVIDEVAGAGEPCAVGEGACRAAGVRVCGDDGALICDAARILPTDEVCNGLDDDCDGAIDDVPGVGEPCAVGVGACLGRGVLRCTDAGPICDARPAPPTLERCNGVDDDCDGVVDDVYGVEQSCAVGRGVCRARATLECSAGGLICPAAPEAPGLEACDSRQDEDCDGVVDEAGCVDPCGDDARCGEGRLCEGGICTAGDCRGDDDCPIGPCLDGICVEGGCRLDADCADGWLCSMGRCVDPGPPCDDAPVIGFGVVRGDLRDGLDPLPPTCGAGTGGVLYRLDPAGHRGPVCITTAGSPIDPVLSVRSDCARAESTLACDADGAYDDDAQLEVEVGDAPLFIEVDGVSEYDQHYILGIAPGPCPCRTGSEGAGDCPLGEACRLGACVTPICGDGRVEGAEECDDGGVQPADGCDDRCRVEWGHACQAASGPCDVIGGTYIDPPTVGYDDALPGVVFRDGGSNAERQCGPGDLMTALYLTFDPAIGAPTEDAIECGHIRASGDGLIVADPPPPWRVADLPQPASVCPPHHVAVGYVAYAPFGFGLICSAVELVDGRLQLGEPMDAPPMGDAVDELARERCPPLQAARGLYGQRADRAYTTVSLRCGALIDQCEGASACAPIGGCIDDGDCEPGLECHDFGCHPPEICNNGIGEGGGDAVDCFDAPVCGAHPACTVGACTDDDDCPDGTCHDGLCAALDRERVYAIAQPGHAIRLAGTLDETRPSWSHPGDSFDGGCRRNGGSGHFETWRLVNRTGVPQRLSIYADSPERWSVLHAYDAAFDPADREARCVTGNISAWFEDGGLFRVPIAPDQEVVLVFTSRLRDDRSFADYRLRVLTAEPPEVCDDGLDNDDDQAVDCDDPNCRLALPCAICGNGLTQEGETCDDGGREPLDGCDADCQLEPEICDSEADEDFDGLIGCEDPDCFRHALCDPPGEEGDLRLVGPTPDRGRLEIFHDGRWGTICNELWGGLQVASNSTVACRQMGYDRVTSIYSPNPGIDPIWLGWVSCNGGERRLIDCNHSEWGDLRGCRHHRDVSIACGYDDP